jgi:response regulator NasT
VQQRCFTLLLKEAELKIAVIDENPARAAVIAEGLREAGLDDVHLCIERRGLVARLDELAPDVVLMNLENPGRDVLEESFAISRALSRPIAMFVDQSDERAIGELAEAKSALAERKLIDQAKALLIKRRRIDEPAAYALLRKQAMDSGRRIAEVADALITAESLLGGGKE